MKRHYSLKSKILLTLSTAILTLSVGSLKAQELCIADTSYSDVLFLIDNSQSIDDQEFDQFEDIIVRTIQKVQDKCIESQIGLVHYGGAFGLETFVEFDLGTDNVFTSVQRQFCTNRNSAGFCPEGGGDDLNNAIGDIIEALNNGTLNRNPNNDFQLVIFTDAFGFEPECTFINCSQILPFTNIDILKSTFDANVTVVGASAQAEASLLAVYASPGGGFDNVQLNNCEGTFDGCAVPRQYIPVEFDSPVEATSDSIAGFVECNITIMQVVNPELGQNLSVCSDLNESVTLSVSLPPGENGVMYEWDNGLPPGQSVTVSPSVTTTYTVVVTDINGCSGTDQITVFAESCLPDCSPDTSYTDIIFLVDNSQSIDDQEFALFEDLMLTTINKVQDKCESSQLGLVHYGGAFGANTAIEYNLSTANQFTSINREYCTVRNSAGFCTEGGGDDLNHAVGDLIGFLEDGSLNRNPINKLRLVIFTDAFGFEDSCTFVNCSQIRPFTNIDILKENFDARVTVVGASEQAEASLLALYASPGGNFDNVQLYAPDCPSTFDGCTLPRKYIPLEFDSPVEESSDSIVACVDCDIEILEGVVASLGPDQTICSDLDSSATINATLLNGVEPLTFQWDNGLPASGSAVVQPSVNTTYNVTITDAIGCTDNTSVTVFVEVCFPCTVAPTMTCPPTFQTCPGQSIAPSAAGIPVVVKGAEACPEIVTSFVDDTTSVVGCNVAIARTWTASYANTNDPQLESTCVQSIVVQDISAPEIFNLPQDIEVNTNQSCTAIVTWSFPNAVDDCALQSISSNIPSGSVFDPGITQVIYSAIDQCGNVSMASFNVTVNETCCQEPPSITCPDNYIGCPGSSIDPSVTGRPTGMAGSDQCTEPTFSFSDQVLNTDPCGQVIQRTWTASYGGDIDQGLTASCLQIITLSDIDAPIISNIPNNIVLDSDLTCSAQVFWEAPEATDNCGIQSFTSNLANGSTFDVGVTTVIYSAQDNCGNMSMASFTVTVVERCCTAPPVITCPSDITLCPESSIDPSVTGFATAIPGGENCPNPNVSFSDVMTGNQANCTVVIRRTWTASYGGLIDGNLTASCVQTITLSDTEAPILSNVPDNIVVDSDQSCTARVTWAEPAATDNCSISSVVSNFSSGSTFDIGITAILYTATDNCGNSTSATFTVTVNEVCCTQPPIITCPPNFDGCPGDGIQPSVTGSATAMRGSANCPEPALSFRDEIINDTSDCALVIQRIWTASYPGLGSDPGLTSTCIQLISLTDRQAPVISGLPDQIMLASDSLCVRVVNWDAPVAADNCGIADIGSDIAPGSVFDIGETPVTYMASDFCGNTSMVSFSVVITQACCQNNPGLLVPPDFYDCVGTPTGPETTGFATATPGSDICLDPIVTFMDSIVSEGPNGEIFIIRTWKAIDPAIDSLMTSVTQIISLDDLDPPVIMDCPIDVTLDPDSPIHTWEEPTAIDDCGVNLTVNIPSGSTFPTGVTEVVYTATDVVGNTATCSFFVTVPEEVMLICPEDFSIRCLNGLGADDFPLPTINTTCDECQADNIAGFQYLGFKNGSSYYISEVRDDWQEARMTAENVGGYLVIINDAEENEFVKNLLPVNSAWIGLQDYDNEEDFRWVNGSQLTYSNWFKRQPNNFGNRQDYVEILPNGEWNDQSNNKSLHYIIEVECVLLTTTIDSSMNDGVFTFTVTYAAVESMWHRR